MTHVCLPLMGTLYIIRECCWSLVLRVGWPKREAANRLPHRTTAVYQERCGHHHADAAKYAFCNKTYGQSIND